MGRFGSFGEACEREAAALSEPQQLATEAGPVAVQGEPLFNGMTDVPPFDRAALIAALRADQAGETAFPRFVQGCWQAGVVRYDVDLTARICTYFGTGEESYVETYPEVTL